MGTVRYSGLNKIKLYYICDTLNAVSFYASRVVSYLDDAIRKCRQRKSRGPSKSMDDSWQQGSFVVQGCSNTAKTHYRKLETNISRKGIVRPQSQFVTFMCLCSHDRSAYSAAGKYLNHALAADAMLCQQKMPAVERKSAVAKDVTQLLMFPAAVLWK